MGKPYRYTQRKKRKAAYNKRRKIRLKASILALSKKR